MQSETNLTGLYTFTRAINAFWARNCNLTEPKTESYIKNVNKRENERNGGKTHNKTPDDVDQGLGIHYQIYWKKCQ